MLPTLFVVMFAGCPAVPTEDSSPARADTADSAALPDRDEDGYTEEVDCNDADATVNPGVAADGCNAVDDDCDGTIDEDPDVSWHLDADGDGYGGAGEAVSACVAPEGYASGTADCDDDNADAWPGADEACDEVDNDCDGEVDEGLPTDIDYWVDADGDGAGDPDTHAAACKVPEVGAFVTNSYDCDDADAANPVWVEHGAGVGAGTVDDPYRKVQDALTAGIACVIVGPGTYSEDLTWPADDLWVRSTEGAAKTTISGSGTAPVLTVAEGSSTLATLEGFTLSGGGGRQVTSSGTSGGTTYYYTKYYGGAVAVGSRAAITLRDSILSDNLLAEYAETTSGSSKYVTASYGGAVYVQGGSLVLDGVVVRDNYAYNGGAFYVTGGQLDAFNTWVGANEGYAWASLYADLSSEVRFTASIFDANQPTSSPGGLAVYDATLQLDHVDVVSHDYGLLSRNAKITVDNSIFAGNAYGMQLTSSTLTMSYSSFHNDTANFAGVTDPTGTNGNVAVDCMFTNFRDDANPDNDTLTLLAGSPCADAADPAELDWDGSANDMGAYGGALGGW